VVLGNVGLTAPAVRSLLTGGTDVVFLTRGGKFLGRLSSGLTRNVLLRREQHRRFDDPVFALDLARRIVAGKIENQRRLLRRHQRRKPDERTAAALVRLRRAVERCSASAADLDTLRGVEGSAAAAYFGCWPSLVAAPGVEFTKRLRRPPPDPVNVLLSFGYTLLGNLVHQAVEAAGLDPFLGCLHEARYGRPSLVLDLIEELRPVVVDSAVLRAINTRAVTPADFTKVGGEDEVEERWEREEYDEDAEEKRERPGPRRPLLFGRAGVKKWLAVYERRLDEKAWYPPREARLALRDVARAQVHLLAAHVRGEAAYAPFLAPR